MAVGPAEVDALYESLLRPRIEALEDRRREVRGAKRRATALVLVPFVLIFVANIAEIFLPSPYGTIGIVVAVVLLIGGALTAGLRYALPGLTAYLNYQQQFKQQVVAEIFRVVCPTATYDADQGLPAELFDEPGLFSTRGRYRSDDRVRGTIGDTPFEAAEVKRTYSSGGKNSRTYTVFHGLFFHIDFNKHVRGTTIVEPAAAPAYRTGDRAGLEPVTLENESFATEFAVHSNDETEARYILTPAMMERLLALRERSGYPVHMAFKGHRVYLGLQVGRSLFEPGIETTTSREAVQEMARLFAMAEAIVHELDLNTRIWTKDVDSSLLGREEAPPPDERLAAVKAQARAGTLTADTLWSAAMAGRPDYQVEDVGEVTPRPDHTSIEVTRSPGEATVAYGGLASILIQMALWAACVAVAISATRALLDAWAPTSAGGALAALVRRLPAIPVVDDYTPMVPIAWLAVAASIGALLQLSWMLRVRAVAIAPDAIRVWRGLRPWPRTYTRPPYGKVVVLQRVVYIAKTSGLGIINTSASPVLKPEEATWVASEMRRALKETASAGAGDA